VRRLDGASRREALSMGCPLTLTLSLQGEGISQRELRAVGVGRILQVETSSFEDEA